MRFETSNQSLIDVVQEREKQINVKGYQEVWDDRYPAGLMAKAAIAFIHSSNGNPHWRDYWPINWKPANPKGPRQDLVRAAALLIAEIDRIDRAEARINTDGRA